MRTGRPKKLRPEKGAPILPGMSLRDVAACLGTDRRWLSKAKMMAEIPEEQFEAAIDSEDHDPKQAVDALLLMVRRRARKKTEYLRRCPHCHMPLRIEDVR